MSPGVVISPKKGGHAVVDSKAGAGTGKGGDKGLEAPDLLKWVEETAGEGLPDRLHFIDLNPSSTRSTLSRHFSVKPDGPAVTMKILVLGDPATGKTSFIKRHVHDFFSERHKTTIGVDFARKELVVKGTTVKLQLWDIAKQDMFGAIARAFYKNALGAILVYEAGRKSTFEAIPGWKSQIDEMVRLPDGTRLPVVLVASKCDVAAVVDREALNSFCLRHGFMGWFETSSKLDFNIDEASRFLAESILEIMPPPGSRNSWVGSEAEKKSSCGDYFCFSWCV